MSGRSDLKRWSAGVLERLNVVREDDGSYTITTAGGTLHYTENGKPKMRADAGTERVLWPDPSDVAGDMVVVVEGEPDAITAHELALPAVAVPGAGKFNPDWPALIAAGRRHVYLFADSDDVGRARMRRLAEQIPQDVNVYVIDFAPERDDGYDLSDVVADFGLEGASSVVGRELDAAQPWEPPAPPPVAVTKQTRSVAWRTLDTVEPRATSWLWRPYLPLGKVVLVAGAPGHGKSQLTALLAAYTTRAEFFPSDLNAPGRVVIVSAEDDLADTVVPRLMAANADIRMVETVNARTEFVGGLTADGLIELPGDVMVLHERLKRGDVRLLVLDPVVSFFGGEHSSLSNQDVRKVLDPLKAMADAYATTIVSILHLNKASEVREWAARIAESHGFQAVARSVIALGPDPQDPEGEAGSKKVLALTKANLVRRAGQSMRLEIAPATVWTTAGAPIETSRVILTGSCDVAADDLLMSDDQRRSQREALDWLEDFLGDGWHKVGEVRTAALRDGHSWRTMERARANTTKTAKQMGVAHGPWWMAMATTPGVGPGTGDLDGVAALEGASNTATPPRPPVTGMGNGGVDQERQGRQIDLDAYRRQRDRILGERDDDD